MTSSRRTVATLLFALTCTLIPAAQTASPHRLLGYYPEWSQSGSPAYTAEQIPYAKLTHIAHAFASLTPAADGTVVIPQGMIEPKLFSLAHASGVKVLLSIGGGDGIQGPRFNEMAFQESTRQAFVSNVRTLLTTYGYDGVDIDWEIPGNLVNESNCTTLMQELRNGLPSPWIISMAVTAEPLSYGDYDIPALAPLVDFFNVMTYDFSGTWSGATGLVSPLVLDPADPYQNGSVKTSMDMYEKQFGVPISKLNMGTPFYGYGWEGVDTNWTACTSCPAGSWNYAPYIKQRINHMGWTVGYDPAARAPYLTNPSLPGFITYDGVESTEEKVGYVKSRGFGGVFMWALGEDYDGASQDLIDAMYAAWQ